jgi:hypothetical protein
MSQCGIDFYSIPLHIAYSSQHFEPIQYVNSPFSSLLIFQNNNLKIIIDLDDFPSLWNQWCNNLLLIITTSYTFLLE